MWKEYDCMIPALCMHYYFSPWQMARSPVSENPELSQEDPVRHALKFNQEKDHRQFFYNTQTLFQSEYLACNWLVIFYSVWVLTLFKLWKTTCSSHRKTAANMQYKHECIHSKSGNNAGEKWWHVLSMTDKKINFKRSKWLGNQTAYYIVKFYLIRKNK